MFNLNIYYKILLFSMVLLQFFILITTPLLRFSFTTSWTFIIKIVVGSKNHLPSLAKSNFYPCGGNKNDPFSFYYNLHWFILFTPVEPTEKKNAFVLWGRALIISTRTASVEFVKIRLIARMSKMEKKISTWFFQISLSIF